VKSVCENATMPSQWALAAPAEHEARRALRDARLAKTKSNAHAKTKELKTKLQRTKAGAAA
jgi:hypothetical protein